MNSKTALEYVIRIERHREEEERIWEEMRSRDDYMLNEDRDVLEAINYRQKSRDSHENAAAIIDGFDFSDD